MASLSKHGLVVNALKFRSNLLAGRPTSNLRFLTSSTADHAAVAADRAFADPAADIEPEVKPWRILTALCVVRKHTLSQAATPLEAEFCGLQQEMARNKSAYNDYELHRMGLQRKMEKISGRSAMLSDEEEAELRDLQRRLASIRENETKWNSERDQPGVVVEGRRNSTSCDEPLHLLVSDDSGLLPKESSHLFPYAELGESETLLQAAQRIATEHGFVPATDLVFTSAAPIGYWEQAADPSNNSHGCLGDKVFFMRATVADGAAVESLAPRQNHRWVTGEEIRGQGGADGGAESGAAAAGCQYFQKIQQFL